MPYDALGAKFNPDFPDPTQACASAYGNSFVWGFGVPSNEGWVEQLSRLLKCRISNYGVEGYGVDQAFIRFRRNNNDSAPVVLVGIFPQDVMRDVNQYRGFLGFPLQPQYVKGRFIVDTEGHLQWLHRPSLDFAQFEKLHTEPAEILPMDDFLPGTPDGPTPKYRSFILTLLSVSLSPRVRTRITGRASTGDFLSETYPSGAFQLTVDIVIALKQEVEQRGKQLLVVMIPEGVVCGKSAPMDHLSMTNFKNNCARSASILLTLVTRSSATSGPAPIVNCTPNPAPAMVTSAFMAEVSSQT